MARPIEPTPPLVGEDAARLLAQLAVVATPEEVARRRLAARNRLAQMMRPKGELSKSAVTSLRR